MLKKSTFLIGQSNFKCSYKSLLKHKNKTLSPLNENLLAASKVINVFPVPAAP